MVVFGTRIEPWIDGHRPIEAPHRVPLLKIEQELERLAHRHHFHYAFIDATTTRIHMIEQIFFQIARGTCQIEP